MRKQLLWPLKFLAILWVVEAVDQFTPFQLDYLGIRPRTLDGLWGIIFSPFLHGSWQHLTGNSVALLMLSYFLVLTAGKDILKITILVGLLSGIGTWLLGSPNSVHVGASGILYGYLGFLLLRGFVEKKFLSVAVSLVVGVLFSYAVFDLFKLQAGISWSGHLCGFLGGLYVARKS